MDDNNRAVPPERMENDNDPPQQQQQVVPEPPVNDFIMPEVVDQEPLINNNVPHELQLPDIDGNENDNIAAPLPQPPQAPPQVDIEEDHGEDRGENDDDVDEVEEENPDLNNHIIHPPNLHLNVLDAGVVDADGGPPVGDIGGPQQAAVAAQGGLVLYLTWSESSTRVSQTWKDHPLLQEGVTVQIGVGKSTRLVAVFERYVEFINEKQNISLQVDDLEFIHCQILNKEETAEMAALMKNDKVKVRMNRKDERAVDEEYYKLQRESDKEYFEQLKLMPYYHDTILDCQGSPADEHGRVQQYLSTLIRCHSPIVKKRCQWLAMLIAKSQRDKNNNNDENDDHNEQHQQHDLIQGQIDLSMEAVRPFQEHPHPYPNLVAEAAQIENDEFEPGHTSPSLSQSSSFSPPLDQPQHLSRDLHMLRVVIHNHYPDAINLLLEYIYTNRVVALGLEAFVQSCRTKPLAKFKGPVPPFAVGNSAVRKWPNRGEPSISFRQSLAAIELAEEAHLPHFSLMCEIAAAQMVTATNVIEALTLCEAQKRQKSNSLPRLRKAAMDVVLRSGPRPVFVLPTFKQALEERSTSFVPTLLVGAMHALDNDENRKKNHQRIPDFSEWQAAALKHFKQVDREDHVKRDRERKKRRYERTEQSISSGTTDSDTAMVVEPSDLSNDINNASCVRWTSSLSASILNNRKASKQQRLQRRAKTDQRRRGPDPR